MFNVFETQPCSKDQHLRGPETTEKQQYKGCSHVLLISVSGSNQELVTQAHLEIWNQAYCVKLE